jgi:putative GTP pyrophosphokinase
MADTENHEHPKSRVDKILAEFDGRKDFLLTVCEKTKTLIEEFLEDAQIRFQSVQGRVKNRDKLKKKYLDESKNYKQLDDIKDLAALRLITYYEDEVDAAAKVIQAEFDIDRENSVDKRETDPDKFGYYAINYVCKYPVRRTSQTEYKKFEGVWFEVQITSILRHAWSEIEHPWYDLKEAFPPEIKRRFARMSALLEIAESEFLALRKLQSDYTRSIAVQVEAEVPDLPVDAVSLRTFIGTDSTLAEIDKRIADSWGARLQQEVPDSLEPLSKAANAAGVVSLQQLRGSLKKYAGLIPEYAVRGFLDLGATRDKHLPVSRGIGICHLFQLLMNLQGTDATEKYLSAAVLTPIWTVDKQVAAAKELAAKYLK